MRSVPVDARSFVREQLKAIDSMTIASAEQKAAMLAFVLGRAIRDGVVLVRGITHDEETEFYDDSTEQLHGDEARTPRSRGPTVATAQRSSARS
jgi:hypothetical protein